ncbi:MAG TPA: methyltransferase domain-containing protein [Kofleriaceae bacterium]|nr:methyltransferase domain-containing protein [Kofleriaceae bacterium]
MKDAPDASGGRPVVQPPGGPRGATWLSLLRCPACRAGAIEREARAARCTACGADVAARDGYLDLVVPAAHLGEPTPSTPEQRLMESELVARLYDRFWRPTFVRLLAGRGAGAVTGGFSGEFFIHKNALGLDDRGGPWLDLSCGTGAFTRAIAAAAPGDWVVGLDISRAMLEVAARRLHGYDNVGLVRADAHDLPFASGSFAGVNNVKALHVYDDPEAVFNEIIRVLARGGIFVGSTFAQSRSPVARLTARMGGIRRFDPPELRAWLSRIGFADYEEIRPGDSIVFRVRKP